MPSSCAGRGRKGQEGRRVGVQSWRRGKVEGRGGASTEAAPGTGPATPHTVRSPTAAGSAGSASMCHTHAHAPQLRRPELAWMSKSSCTCGATSESRLTLSISASGCGAEAGCARNEQTAARCHVAAPAAPRGRMSACSATPRAVCQPTLDPSNAAQLGSTSARLLPLRALTWPLTANPQLPASATPCLPHTCPIIITLPPGLSCRSATVSASPAGLPPLPFSPSSFMRFSLTVVAASSLRLIPCGGSGSADEWAGIAVAGCWDRRLVQRYATRHHQAP